MHEIEIYLNKCFCIIIYLHYIVLYFILSMLERGAFCVLCLFIFSYALIFQVPFIPY